MEFRSKGLGKRTVALRLADGTTVKSGENLYISGTMTEPMTWDYIIVLTGDDIAEFVGLLGERSFAEYLWRSPDRWKIYRSLLTQGLHLVALLVRGAIDARRGVPLPEEPTIQVPPPRDRSKRSAVSRRRLGARRDARLARESAAADQEPTSTSMVAAPA